MRAPGLLPLLPLLLLLLLRVSSQDDQDAGSQSQSLPSQASKASITSSNPGAVTPTPASTPTAAQAGTSMAKAENTQSPVVVATTTVQNIIATSKPGQTLSPTTLSPATVIGTPTTKASVNAPPPTTTPSHTTGKDSPSASPGTLTTAIPDAKSTAAPQPGGPTGSLGSSAAAPAAPPTSAANPVPTNTSSHSGAAGASATSPSKTQPQGTQPSDQSPGTTVSTTTPGTDPPRGTQDCVVSPPPCATKQPHSSSAQGTTSPARPGSTKSPVTSSVGSPSPHTTKTSLVSAASDKISEAATTPTSGADQRTHDAGSASAKPTSASSSPASAWPAAPAPGNQTDQTGSCGSGQQHPNISLQNTFECEEQAQGIRPTIHLKEPKTCDQWKNDSSSVSFFESFCSTAQRAFNASRDKCTVMLMSCQRPSRHWAVRVVLHLPLDPEQVLEELREKKDKLEELGIVNITSDKMEGDMVINDELSTPLIITIVALAGSLLLIAAIYGCCHQRFSHKKDQNIHPDLPGFDDGHVALIFNQRLTEELQTMENGYHDNPTLEVMETSSEMQEKKVNLNGELGDSWIVPLDTLTKEDLEEEEDTHL